MNFLKNDLFLKNFSSFPGRAKHKTPVRAQKKPASLPFWAPLDTYDVGDGFNLSATNCHLNL